MGVKLRSFGSLLWIWVYSRVLDSHDNFEMKPKDFWVLPLEDASTLQRHRRCCRRNRPPSAFMGEHLHGHTSSHITERCNALLCIIPNVTAPRPVRGPGVTIAPQEL